MKKLSLKESQEINVSLLHCHQDIMCLISKAIHRKDIPQNLKAEIEEHGEDKALENVINDYIEILDKIKKLTKK